jgi:toxin ParE1/3/4
MSKKPAVRIEWTTFALMRVLEFSEYMAVERTPPFVEAWIDGLFERTSQLEMFPQSGRIVPELTTASVREIRYEQYRIIYRVHADTVYILTVRHTRQRLSESDFEEHVE